MFIYPVKDMFSPEELNTVGGRIRAERLSRYYYYPGELAKMAGIPEKVYNDIEWGLVEPTQEQLHKIANALHCSVYNLTRRS